MVKGISRQVIVVQSPDPKMFDQAIFILNDNAVGENGVTDEALLKEAKRLIGIGANRQKNTNGPVWACAGALLMAVAWFFSTLL